LFAGFACVQWNRYVFEVVQTGTSTAISLDNITAYGTIHNHNSTALVAADGDMQWLQ
jgi:hypothetical protein